MPLPLVANPLAAIVADVALGAIQIALEARQMESRAAAGEPLTVEGVTALVDKLDALRGQNRKTVEELLNPQASPPA